MIKFKCVANLTHGENRFSIGETYSKEDLKKVEEIFLNAHFIEVEVEEEAQADGEGEEKDLSSLKVDEIKEALTALGVEIPEGLKKAELLELLKEAQADGE